MMEFQTPCRHPDSLLPSRASLYAVICPRCKRPLSGKELVDLIEQLRVGHRATLLEQLVELKRRQPGTPPRAGMGLCRGPGYP